MSDDISPDEYYSVVERPTLSDDDQRRLAERDKFFLKYGIELGLLATPDNEITPERIDQVYKSRHTQNLSRKNGIKL